MINKVESLASRRFWIYSLETNPLRLATLFQGASHTEGRIQQYVLGKAFMLVIARRSRRAVNQSGRRTSKSLGVNSLLTSTAKTSTQDLPQTASRMSHYLSAVLLEHVAPTQYLARSNRCRYICFGEDVWSNVDVADALRHTISSSRYPKRRRGRSHLLTGPHKASVR